jgi:hypothetical protein
MLVVHQWFLYTVLALEVVPQTALITVLSAGGGFLVWWSQLAAIGGGEASDADKAADRAADDSTEYSSALISLVGWCARPPCCNPVRCTAAALQPHPRPCTNPANLRSRPVIPHL